MNAKRIITSTFADEDILVTIWEDDSVEVARRHKNDRCWGPPHIGRDENVN